SESEASTVKQSQHSTVCARPGGHNGHHVALDNLWPSHGRTQRKTVLKAREESKGPGKPSCSDSKQQLVIRLRARSFASVGQQGNFDSCSVAWKPLHANVGPGRNLTCEKRAVCRFNGLKG